MATYIYGNAVRKEHVNGVAVRKKELEKERLKREKQQRVNRNVKRNRAAAMRMNAKSVLFLSFAVCVTFITCIGYLKLQSDATQNLKQISSMKSTLCDIEQENNMKYNNIVTNVNLEEIREIAISELGMSHPTKEQVIEFEVTEHQNFMDVYADPEDFE